MARLSADLIRRSPQFLSAIKERVLDLRGNKIAILDNLGATEDQFDTIDLSDNEIVKLENFPFMNRLGTLLINNNRITRINPNLGEFLPKMHTLVLMNNRLTSLAEIDPLASLPKLQFLSLLDNTVTKQPDYRLYVIHKLKHLRLLDFKKVKQQERPEAAQKFHSKEAEKAARKVAAKAYTPLVMDAQGTTKDQGPKVVAPTPAQITAIKTLKDEETRKKYDYAVAHPEERTEAAQKFHSKEAEEEAKKERDEAPKRFHPNEAEEAAKKVAAKAYTPVVMDAQGTTKDQGPKVVTPTPAQITAIKTLKGEETREKYDYAVAHPEATNMNYQGQELATWFAEETFGADLDCTHDTLKSKIELYIYQNFVRVPFNFISSWRKTPLFGMHILPPPRRQEPDDCAYHATLALMECGFKVMYAKRPAGQPREFNVKLSHRHLKKMVLEYITSEEGQGFKPRDLLRVCLRMVMRHGVVSEEDYDKGRLPQAIRYWILSYKELTPDQMQDIPDMLEEARMVLTSFRVTPRYRVLLPHEIYRYVPAEDPACQPWTGDKKPVHQSHCVVLTSPGLAYKALEECATEAEVSMPERYYEYLNSYSVGYGVDGCGFIFSDSIRKCYIIDV